MRMTKMNKTIKGKSRGSERFNDNHEILVQILYEDDLMSASDIAKILGRTPPGILHVLRRMGVCIRGYADALSVRGRSRRGST